MKAIIWRELKSYFYSPVAYILIGFYIFISSILFVLYNLKYLVADISYLISSMIFILLFLMPLLTMRLLAEERKNATEILLLTTPLKLTAIVVGKYLACLLFFLMMTGVSLIYPLILFIYGQPDLPLLIGNYLGLILLGASFIAVGIFTSSLTENQMIAALLCFIALLVIWIIDAVANFIGGIPALILSWFSLLSRFSDFNTGILNLNSIIYYLCFITFFIFLTIRMIEKRRWREE